MKELVIDRALWLRGDGERSKLLDDFGGRCCLGFLARACGYADDAILGEPEPNAMSLIKPKDPVWDAIAVIAPVSDDDALDDAREVIWHQTEVCDRLITVNDDDGIEEHVREACVADLLASIGVSVTFVGEPGAGLKPPEEEQEDDE